MSPGAKTEPTNQRGLALTSRPAFRRALACLTAGAALLCVVPAAGAAPTEQLTLPADQFFTPDFGSLCTNENILVDSGTIHIVGQLSDEGANNTHQKIHFNTQSVSGVGTVSGERYSISQVSNNLENVHFATGAREFTGETTLNVVSRGGTENFVVHQIVHFTTNANGEETAVVIGGHADCRG
jgi:hypothetical protein